MDTNQTENQAPDTLMPSTPSPSKSRINTHGIVIGLILLLAGTLWLGRAYWIPARVADLSLLSLDGDTYTLDDRQDNPVLVVFWSTTCLQCLREIPDLISMYNDLHPAGLEIIGVAMPYDPPSNVVATSASIGINYPIALDVEGKVGNAFGGIAATPSTFLVAPGGKIIMQNTGVTDMEALKKLIQEVIQEQAGLTYYHSYMSEGSAT